jgi:hypothetical protein
MVCKNLQSNKPTSADIEMAVRAVEGVPNAMDMDFSGVDPDPTSLDIVPEGNGLVTDETGSDSEYLADDCIVCGQQVAED